MLPPANVVVFGVAVVVETVVVEVVVVVVVVVLAAVEVVEVAFVDGGVVELQTSTNRIKYFNPFKPNGISHFYQLNQSISVLRDVRLYFSFILKF